MGDVYELDSAIGVASGQQDDIRGAEVVAKHSNTSHLWWARLRFFMKA